MARLFAGVRSRLQSLWRALVGRKQLEQEMDAELAHHLEMLTADLARAGFEPAEAARRARIALGTVDTHKEGMRTAMGLGWWDELALDLRYAARMMRKSPGFTAVAVVSLALAIGANTTIFSLVNRSLYARVAAPHPEELRLLSWVGTQDHVAVHHTHGDYNSLPGGMATSNAFSYTAYQQLRAQNRTMGDLFAFQRMVNESATIRRQAQGVRAELVSGNYFSELGVGAQLGRVITAADDAVAGQVPIAVISDGLWERAFGRSPAVLGETLKVNDVILTIVGVAPKGFTGAKNAQRSADLFVPLAMQPLLLPHTGSASWLTNPNQWWVCIMARARKGVPDATAEAELNSHLGAIVRATMPVRPGEDVPQLRLRDGSRGLFEFENAPSYARSMAVLMALVGFVLLLACANIANLMLARGARRQREMGVRLALGAGRMRILRQMLVESSLLAAMGGAGGLLAGYFCRNLPLKLTEQAWDRLDMDVPFDWKVFGFTAAVTLLTGLLFGIAPALAAGRVDVSNGLKETGQSATRRRKGMGGKALVGFQIALSTLLVIGAGLFLRTLEGLKAVPVGFRTDHLLLAEIGPPAGRYPAGKDVPLHQRLEQAFAALPGVESVAAATVPYLADSMSATDFLPIGEHYDPRKHQEEVYNAVGNRFFETLGIPILEGRGFGTQDTATSARVAVINRSLARTRFPNQDPIGKHFVTDGQDQDGHAAKLVEDSIEVVGVCGDTRYWKLRDEPPPQFFLPYVQQREVGGMVYEIRSELPVEQLAPTLRRALQQIDPDLPLTNVRTQDQQIDADLSQERLFVSLTSGFGFLALALASVGIYGVMAYSVANRRNEIGIRMALGAQPGQVMRMVLGESAGIAGVGVAVGVGAALAMVAAVKSMLYGIAPYDLPTIAGSVALLLGVALVAGWLPARRAAGVQPMEALRHE